MERAVERAELLQQQGNRGEALAALERARLLAQEAQPPAHLTERLASVQDLLDAEGKDLEFVARYEAIRRGTEMDVSFQKGGYSTKEGRNLHEALQHYGIAVGVTPPAVVVARLQGRPPAVRRSVLAALDERLQIARNRDSWLTEVLQQADGDPWRTQVRKMWGDIREIEELAEVVDVSEQSPSFLVAIVKSLRARPDAKKTTSGLNLARRTQRAYPDDFWANYQLGLALREIGKPAEAIPYLTAAIALQPRNPLGYQLRAWLYLDLHEETEAFADNNRALELAPRFAVAWSLQSILLKEQGDLQGYERAIRQTLALAPNYSVVRLNYGMWLREQGRSDEAEREMREVISTDPKYIGAREQFASLLIARGKHDEAEAVCREGVHVDPENARAHVALATLLLNRKKGADEAEQLLLEALRLDPDYGSAHYTIGRLFRSQKKLPEAAAAYAAAAAKLPGVQAVNAYMYLGEVQGSVGQWDEAASAFESFLATSTAPARRVTYTNDYYRSCLALLDLYSGNEKRYQTTTDDMLKNAADPKMHKAAGNTLLAALLSPSAVSETEPVQNLLALIAQAKSRPDHLLAQALAEYRASNFAQARAHAERVCKYPHYMNKSYEGPARILLAMVEYRLGQTHAARETLDAAQALIAKTMPEPSLQQPLGPWDVWLMCQILGREAQALLQEP